MKNPIDQHWEDWQKRHSPRGRIVEPPKKPVEEVPFVDDLEPVEETPPESTFDFDFESSTTKESFKKPKRR